MHRRSTIIPGAVTALVALVVVVALAGCGGGTSSSATASPTATQGGALSTLQALRSYLGRVQPIVSQVDGTLSSLPDAMSGMSKLPDQTWTTAATKLETIASQLGAEATNLSALVPPDALVSVQAAAVKVIQSAQSAVSKTATVLNTPAKAKATAESAIQAKIDGVRTQLSQATAKLVDSIMSLIVSPSPTP